MTILNIGPVEFILVLVLMFILLGPEGMIKTARQIGVWIRKTVQSPMWAEIMGYSREIRELPTKIVRETGLDEDLKEINKIANEVRTETQGSINQVNSEISQVLKDTGTVELKVDGNGQVRQTSSKAPGESLPSVGAGGQSGNVVSEPVKPVVEEPKPPVVID